MKWAFKVFDVRHHGALLKTPQGKGFQVPSEDLAKAIEAEWDKDPSPHYQKKPLTSLAATALDRIAEARDRTIEELEKAVPADALLFWAEMPSSLVKAQSETWLPLISKVNSELLLTLKPTQGLTLEPLEDRGKLKTFLDQLNDFTLMGFLHLVTLTESFCVSYLTFKGKLTPEEAWEVVRLPERSQQVLWGEDSESKAQEEILKAEFLETVRFLELSK